MSPRERLLPFLIIDTQIILLVKFLWTLFVLWSLPTDYLKLKL